MSEELAIQKELTLEKVPLQIVIQGDWIEERDKILSESQAIKVKDQQSFTNAEFTLKKITGHSNELEKKRKELAAPFMDAQKKIKALADQNRADLEDEKTRLKKGMAKWIEAEEAKRKKEEEAAARLAAENAKSDPFGDDADTAPSELVTAAPRKFASSARIVYDFEVVNPNLVPREFCSPDLSKIRTYINSNKDAAKIDGVDIKKTTKVQSR